MGLARAWSVALLGMDGVPVEIEADIGMGLPGVQLVGLPDTALAEARDRVRAAVRNSGQGWPEQRVTLALSPATLPKLGSRYDLGLACAVLAAGGRIPAAALGGLALLGELSLDGRLRPVQGLLPCLLAARRAGLRAAVVPQANLAEAGLVPELTVHGAQTLREVLGFLTGERDLALPDEPAPAAQPDQPDLADVVGQTEARWAMEVCAAGGHQVLLTGPPGTGKSMLAHRLPGLLPELDHEQALQTTAIHSVAGTLPPGNPLITAPPMVAPHHTSSLAALVGGGSGLARPGAVSLAHHGILLIDEACEYSPRLLDALRTPLEEGEVRLARKDGVARYPARFQLVLATNPCPCAAAKDTDCGCAPQVRRRYLGRLSGPLLDRVDLQVSMYPVTALHSVSASPESTAQVRRRVGVAREIARHRWRHTGWRCNAEVPARALRATGVSRSALSWLDRGLREGRLTARGADRALRVAFTLGDLAGREIPQRQDVSQALNFRARSAA